MQFFWILNATLQRLRAMNPILLESFPLSLEEIFMDEMEGEEQDYADIFK